MNLQGTITDIKVRIQKKLCVDIVIKGNDFFHEAILPYHYLDAILPKEILIGESKEAKESVLSSIEIILTRLLCGRKISFNHNGELIFPSWKNVIFNKERRIKL